MEVVVDEYKESDDMVRIMATLYVERETQKAIVIGKGGQAIKKLGMDARAELEDFIGQHVFLDLSVKVLKDWRNNESIINRFGYGFTER